MTQGRFDIDGNTVTFEGVADEILNEIYYLVSFNGYKFIMAIDADTATLKIQGAAPYLARDYEDQISDRIQAFNDDFI